MELYGQSLANTKGGNYFTLLPKSVVGACSITLRTLSRVLCQTHLRS